MEHCFESLTIKVLKGSIKGNGCKFLMKVCSAYLILGDDDGGEVNLFVLDNLSGIDNLIVEFSEVKVVVAILLLCEDIVEYPQPFVDLLVKEAVIINAGGEQFVNFLLQLFLIVTECAQHYCFHIFHLKPKSAL